MSFTVFVDQSLTHPSPKTQTKSPEVWTVYVCIACSVSYIVFAYIIFQPQIPSDSPHVLAPPPHSRVDSYSPIFTGECLYEDVRYLVLWARTDCRWLNSN